MALPIAASDLISPLLLVKALLAWLAFFIFIYYRHYWNAAKQKLPVHFFFTKWRAVKHAYFLGYASLGFALGFSLELFGAPLGLSPNAACIPLIDFTRKEMNVLGSRNNLGVFGTAIETVRRHAPTIGRLITHRFPLERVGEALELMAEHPEETEKVIVTLRGAA